MLTRRVGVELKNAFRAELARESTAALAALQFKAVVDEVQMQVCHVSLGAWQGGFRVRVTWTVQAPGSDRILYRGATTGAYLSAQAQTRPAAEGLRQAMAAAAHELVADPRLAGVATAHADAMGAGRQLAAADRPGVSLSALE